MSLSLPVNPRTSGFSSTTTTKTSSLPLHSNFLSLPKTSKNSNTYTILLNKINNKPHLLQTWCKKKQNSQTQQNLFKPNTTYRRNLIAALGGSTVVAFLTTLMTTRSPTKEGSSSSSSSTTTTHDHDHHDKLMKFQEFGSQPRKLESPIRVLVSKPKQSSDKSKKKKGTYVLIIEDIDIPNDEPARFDVYVAKPHEEGDEEDEEDSDFGEFAGSLVDLSRIRTGRNSPKGSLELGISCLLKEIGGIDSDKLVITLKPRSGEVSIGGIRIEYVYYSD